MTLRFFAALSLILGVVALFGYLNLLGEGPLAPAELRHLRAMKDRGTAPAHPAPWSAAAFSRLPSGGPPGRIAALETTGVSVEGYVQRILRAMDNDDHLEITTAPRHEGGPDSSYVTAEITPGWRARMPGWSYERLAAGFRANHGTATAWDGGPCRTRISGWLCYDFQYDYRPSPWSLRYGASRVSGWEIHPVTRIELWDDASHRFVDFH